MKPVRTLAAVVGMAALFFAAAAWYARAHWAQVAILNPAGPIGLAERNVMLFTLSLCAIIVVPVFAMLAWVTYAYRDDHPEAKRNYHPNFDHDSKLAELIWWAIPSLIIAVLAVVAWQSSYALDPYKPLPGDNAIIVQVVGLDWKWLFIYPQEGIAAVNELVIPVDTPVRFELTTDAPMNSLWIPQLGGQIMAMPGMTTQLNLEADREGEFSGFSGNISGEGFAGMAFAVRAISQDAFDAWVQSVRESNHPLTAQSYAALALPSTYDKPAYYSNVESGLYTSIVMRSMTLGTAMQSPQNHLRDGGMPMQGMTMP
jgi:cytochrome o ubiquinol oxidase subunit 2